MAWDAWGGDAGQSWANGLNNQVASVRAIEGAIGISDFDDTLYVAGGLNQRVYDFIDSQDVDLVVVTGRHEADREATVALLDKLGVEYKDLVMQPDGMQDSASFKGEVASKFLADGLDVIFVVENNAEARKAYRDAGVEAVYSPDDLPATASVRQMEDTGMGEDAPLTKDELLSKVEELKSSVLELVGELVETVSDLSDLVENVVLEPVVEDVVPQVDLEVDAARFVEPVKVAELHERGERVEQGIERRELHNLELRIS